jgi:C1A family cysteine protease
MSTLNPQGVSSGHNPPSDLRGLMAAIRDQGKRPTCVAFAVSAAHELSRADGGAVNMDLSEEALYWGSKQTDGDLVPGTRFHSADSALRKWGQPLEAAWPYAPGRDDSQPYPTIASAGEPSWLKGALRDIPVTVPAITAELCANRAVAVGLRLSTGFFYPVNGRVGLPNIGEQSLGNHAVLIVGYSNTTGNQSAEFIIRNSWGTGWGDQGYGYLPIGWLRHVLQAWVIN